MQTPYCKLINIVWPDRGILLSIIITIIKKYNKLLKKIIVINNKRYRKFLRIIFPELKFSKFIKIHTDNFYFNIRSIIIKQDIMIDYLTNYDDVIKTSKIYFSPWYDMNDPLIIYEYNENNDCNVEPYKIFIKKFSLCRRGNYYNGYSWDNIIEMNILNKYINQINNNFNIDTILSLLNKHLSSEYTDTVINRYIIHNSTIPVSTRTVTPTVRTPKSTTTLKTTSDNTDDIIDIINDKIVKLNELLV